MSKRTDLFRPPKGSSQPGANELQLNGARAQEAQVAQAIATQTDHKDQNENGNK